MQSFQQDYLGKKNIYAYFFYTGSFLKLFPHLLKHYKQNFTLTATQASTEYIISTF